jgi:hypothetical protein
MLTTVDALRGLLAFAFGLAEAFLGAGAAFAGAGAFFVVELFLGAALVVEVDFGAAAFGAEGLLAGSFLASFTGPDVPE